MQIIIETNTETNVDTAVNIFYTEFDQIHEWIINYLKTKLDSLNSNNDLPGVSYKICDNYTIEKCVDTVTKGYIYSTKKSNNNAIFVMKILHYNDYKSNLLMESLQVEINNRIVKTIDKDTLIQITKIFNMILTSKSSWNTSELIHIQSDLFKNYKKNLYSSIVNNLNRFGRTKSLVLYGNHESIPISYNMVDDDTDW